MATDLVVVSHSCYVYQILYDTFSTVILYGLKFSSMNIDGTIYDIHGYLLSGSSEILLISSIRLLLDVRCLPVRIHCKGPVVIRLYFDACVQIIKYT